MEVGQRSPCTWPMEVGQGSPCTWPTEVGHRSPSAAPGYFLQAAEAAPAGDDCSASGCQRPGCWGGWGVAFAGVAAAASCLGDLVVRSRTQKVTMSLDGPREWPPRMAPRTSWTRGLCREAGPSATVSEAGTAIGIVAFLPDPCRTGGRPWLPVTELL